MSRSQLYATFLLHHRPYRDSSLLVDAFTADHGRLTLVARGVRGGKRPRAALLQKFRPLLMSWSGRGELKTLNNVEPAGSEIALQGRQLFCGFYLNELLLKLLGRDDPHPGLFALYQTSLERLLHDMDPEPALRIFEKRLLDELGYGLTLTKTSDGQSVDAGAHYAYTIESGPEMTIAETTAAYPGKSLIELNDEEFADPRSLADAKRLLRTAIDFYLGDRPLKTRQIMYSMRR